MCSVSVIHFARIVRLTGFLRFIRARCVHRRSVGRLLLLSIYSIAGSSRRMRHMSRCIACVMGSQLWCICLSECERSISMHLCVCVFALSDDAFVFVVCSHASVNRAMTERQGRHNMYLHKCGCGGNENDRKREREARAMVFDGGGGGDGGRVVHNCYYTFKLFYYIFYYNKDAHHDLCTVFVLRLIVSLWWTQSARCIKKNCGIFRAHGLVRGQLTRPAGTCFLRSYSDRLMMSFGMDNRLFEHRAFLMEERCDTNYLLFANKNHRVYTAYKSWEFLNLLYATKNMR